MILKKYLTDYFDWYCDFDMICSFRVNNKFHDVILIFLEKHVEIIKVWFLQGSVPNKDVFLNLKNVMCRPGNSAAPQYILKHTFPLEHVLRPLRFQNNSSPYCSFDYVFLLTVQPRSSRQINFLIFAARPGYQERGKWKISSSRCWWNAKFQRQLSVKCKASVEKRTYSTFCQ